MRNRAIALQRQAQEIPDKVAIHFQGEAFTFGRLAELSRAYAAGLSKAGVQRNDKVALMLATRPEFIAIEYAIYTLGATLVPFNIHYREDEIIHALQACEVDFMIADAEYAARLSPDFAEQCPALAALYAFGNSETERPAWSRDASELCADPAAAPAPVELGRDDVPLMLYTSATTGKAKGVMLTIGNLESNYDQTPSYLRLGREDVILCALPLYNTFGLNQCINVMVSTGATMILLPRFDPLACLEAIQRYRCTFFPSVPTMLQKMLYHPQVEQYDLGSLRRFCVGAAPVPAPLLSRLRKHVGTDAFVVNGYGLTEATAIVAVHEVVMGADGELLRGKSIGRPIPGIEMRILDEEGRALPTDTVGEICVKGPTVMKGYYRQPEVTAEAIVDGWLRTGDLGMVDADGYFTIVDRRKDLIIRGGQNIYPADIEEVLYQHPAVAEAAVVALADDVLGEVPKAFVALRPGNEAEPSELIEHCKKALAYYKVPVDVEVLAELPKGPTGKILRRQLRVTPDDVAKT